MLHLGDTFDNEQRSSGILKQFIEMIQCATGDDEHIYKEPIALSCGHYICKSCITDNCDKVKCTKCREENTSNLRTLKVSAIAQFSIQSNIQRLICITKEKFKDLFLHLESNLNKVLK